MFNKVGEKLKKDAVMFFVVTSFLGCLGAVSCLFVALKENSFALVSGYLMASLVLLCTNALISRLIYGIGILVAKEEESERQSEEFDIV
ncbi:MAG: hypothetical protein IJN04_02695 [Clostridia bacterium]|nr:hypothetical protein [Clostridia bacterium]